MRQIQMQESQIIKETRIFIQKVYLWMFLGLTISGITAYILGSNFPSFKHVLFDFMVVGNLELYFCLLMAWGIMLSGFTLFIRIRKLRAWFMKKNPAGLLVFLFLLYSFLTGIILSILFLGFTIKSIATAFFITAGMFGLMSIYGYLTKKDLTQVGQVLIMGFFGLALASSVNLFYGNHFADYVSSFVGVIVFAGLAAYDTQVIKRTNIIGNEGSSEDLKEVVVGALTLYIDFINLFIELIKSSGRRK